MRFTIQAGSKNGKVSRLPGKPVPASVSFEVCAYLPKIQGIKGEVVF